MTDLHHWMIAEKVKERVLAKSVGVNQSTISRVRHRKIRPKPELAEKLSLISGIPVWNFLRPLETDLTDDPDTGTTLAPS